MPLLLGPLLAQAITLTAGDRTEVRARTQSGEMRSDATTSATLQLARPAPPFSWTLAYNPSFTWMSFGASDSQKLIMQGVRAFARLQDRRTAFELSEDLTYGRQNYRVAALSAPTAGSPPGSTAQPSTSAVATSSLNVVDQVVLTGSTSTTARLMHTLSPRLSALASAGYTESGGLDSASRATVPLFRTGSGTASMGYRLTPVDDLMTSGTGTATQMWNGETRVRNWIVTIQESWLRRWSRQLTSRLSAGVAPTSSSPGGVASAAVTYQDRVASGTLGTVAAMDLASLIDARTGELAQAVSASVSSSWLTGHFGLSGSASAVQSLDAPSSRGFSSYGLGATALYTMETQLTFEGGVRAARSVSAGTSSPPEWAAFVAVRYTSTLTYF